MADSGQAPWRSAAGRRGLAHGDAVLDGDPGHGPAGRGRVPALPGPGGAEGAPRLAAEVAAVAAQTPQPDGHERALDEGGGAGAGGDVLDPDEAAARAQDAADLGDGGGLVEHGAQDKAAHDGVDRGGWERQRRRIGGMEGDTVGGQTCGEGGLAEAGMHELVGFDEVELVGPGGVGIELKRLSEARANLHNGSSQWTCNVEELFLRWAQAFVC